MAGYYHQGYGGSYPPSFPPQQSPPGLNDFNAYSPPMGYDGQPQQQPEYSPQGGYPYGMEPTTPFLDQNQMNYFWNEVNSGHIPTFPSAVPNAFVPSQQYPQQYPQSQQVQQYDRSIFNGSHMQPPFVQHNSTQHGHQQEVRQLGDGSRSMGQEQEEEMVEEDDEEDYAPPAVDAHGAGRGPAVFAPKQPNAGTKNYAPPAVNPFKPLSHYEDQAPASDTNYLQTQSSRLANSTYSKLEEQAKKAIKDFQARGISYAQLAQEPIFDEYERGLLRALYEQYGISLNPTGAQTARRPHADSSRNQVIQASIANESTPLPGLGVTAPVKPTLPSRTLGASTPIGESLDNSVGRDAYLAKLAALKGRNVPAPGTPDQGTQSTASPAIITNSAKKITINRDALRRKLEAQREAAAKQAAEILKKDLPPRTQSTLSANDESGQVTAESGSVSEHAATPLVDASSPEDGQVVGEGEIMGSKIEATIPAAIPGLNSVPTPLPVADKSAQEDDANRPPTASKQAEALPSPVKDSVPTKYSYPPAVSTSAGYAHSSNPHLKRPASTTYGGAWTPNAKRPYNPPQPQVAPEPLVIDLSSEDEDGFSDDEMVDAANDRHAQPTAWAPTIPLPAIREPSTQHNAVVPSGVSTPESNRAPQTRDDQPGSRAAIEMKKVALLESIRKKEAQKAAVEALSPATSQIVKLLSEPASSSTPTAAQSLPSLDEVTNPSSASLPVSVPGIDRANSVAKQAAIETLDAEIQNDEQQMEALQRQMALLQQQMARKNAEKAALAEEIKAFGVNPDGMSQTQMQNVRDNLVEAAANVKATQVTPKDEALPATAGRGASERASDDRIAPETSDDEDDEDIEDDNVTDEGEEGEISDSPDAGAEQDAEKTAADGQRSEKVAKSAGVTLLIKNIPSMSKNDVLKFIGDGRVTAQQLKLMGRYPSHVEKARGHKGTVFTAHVTLPSPARAKELATKLDGHNIVKGFPVICETPSLEPPIPKSFTTTGGQFVVRVDNIPSPLRSRKALRAFVTSQGPSQGLLNSRFAGAANTTAFMLYSSLDVAKLAVRSFHGSKCHKSVLQATLLNPRPTAQPNGKVALNATNAVAKVQESSTSTSLQKDASELPVVRGTYSSDNSGQSDAMIESDDSDEVDEEGSADNSGDEADSDSEDESDGHESGDNDSEPRSPALTASQLDDPKTAGSPTSPFAAAQTSDGSNGADDSDEMDESDSASSNSGGLRHDKLPGISLADVEDTPLDDDDGSGSDETRSDSGAEAPLYEAEMSDDDEDSSALPVGEETLPASLSQSNESNTDSSAEDSEYDPAPFVAEMSGVGEDVEQVSVAVVDRHVMPQTSQASYDVTAAAISETARTNFVDRDSDMIDGGAIDDEDDDDDFYDPEDIGVDQVQVAGESIDAAETEEDYDPDFEAAFEAAFQDEDMEVDEPDEAEHKLAAQQRGGTSSAMGNAGGARPHASPEEAEPEPPLSGGIPGLGNQNVREDDAVPNVAGDALVAELPSEDGEILSESTAHDPAVTADSRVDSAAVPSTFVRSPRQRAHHADTRHLAMPDHQRAVSRKQPPPHQSQTLGSNIIPLGSSSLAVPTAHSTTFTPFQSALKGFKSYRYHPAFSQDVSGGIRSLTYSHRIDALQPLCFDESQGNPCTAGTHCPGQHFKDVGLPDTDIIRLIGTISNSGKPSTKEEQKEWATGLRQVIEEIRKEGLKDVDQVAEKVVAYRRAFFGNSIFEERESKVADADHAPANETKEDDQEGVDGEEQQVEEDIQVAELSSEGEIAE